MNWLGTRTDRWSPESFPDGRLNSKQLHLVLTLDDKTYGRINGIYPVTQMIAQVTDDIVEVHVSISRSWYHARHCILWINAQGKMVASAIVTGDDRMAESYWRLPTDLDKFGHDPITTVHDVMWGLGVTGAIPETREFIRKHYTESE